MCTVSFLPTTAGFRLAMNRDEKRTRVAALPPEVFRIDERRAIYPREPNDGTWLAVNDAGVCLALINWHRIEREPEGKLESRGRLIPQLIGASDEREVGRRLRKMGLGRVRPFRLISIDPRRRTVTEWQWDTIALTARRHRWQIAHWFSSGYDEAKAENQRKKVCVASSLGTTSALRKLHASHLPKRGPFSICMHRPDAATVSYSEVVATAKRVTLRYQPGPPCQARESVARSL
jgi:Transport and Golgi organisation 2